MKNPVLISLAILAAPALAWSVEPRFSAPPDRSAETNSVQLAPEFIARLAEEMRTNHPALLAMVARTNAAAAGVRAVRTWDDPMLRVGGLAAREDMRADDGDIIYGAEQKLPLFGKPALARRAAQVELDVEMASADYQFQILRSELAKLTFRTAFAGQVIVIGQQDLGWLQTISETMEARYQSGGATRVEVLQVKNEQGKRETQLQTDRANLTHLHVSLNRLLNRDLQSPWPALELPAVAGPVEFSEKLVNYATRYEPKLRMMRERVRLAQAMLDSTRRRRLPEVSAGIQSRNYSGKGDWRQTEFMLSFNLPLFNSKRYRADIEREEAGLEAARFDAADYELSLREEVHQLTVKIDAARREALLYGDDILPRSRLALESARAAWEAGRGAFRDVLDARRMLLEARLMQSRAVAEQYQMLSELVLCCGLGDMESLQMIGAEPKFQSEGTKP